MLGDSGYAGGRLRLAVARNWLGITQEAASPVKGVGIQYRGGHGGNGQKGGAKIPGTDGGLTVIFNPITENLDGSGNGGDAGEPGTIADSEVLVVTGEWPNGWRVTLNLGQPGTDSEFGKPGVAGKGTSAPKLYWLDGVGCAIFTPMMLEALLS